MRPVRHPPDHRQPSLGTAPPRQGSYLPQRVLTRAVRQLFDHLRGGGTDTLASTGLGGHARRHAIY
jgi:hypothetical protein